MGKQDILQKMVAALLEQDRSEVCSLVEQALKAGVTPMEILNDGLAAGLQELGVLFSEEEVFLPELLLSAEIVTGVMKELGEKFKDDSAKIEKRGKVLLATVEGDVHDIGKNLVGMIMSASGYEIFDAGKDVAGAKLIEMIKEIKPDIVGLSALLATTMPAQRDFVEMVTELGMRDQIKVIVGGAPVTREWADKIGADGWAEDAPGAVMEANRLLPV